MNKVYLANYHGQADKLFHRICDGLTKFLTHGQYSHCEIAIAGPHSDYYHCLNTLKFKHSTYFNKPTVPNTTYSVY